MRPWAVITLPLLWLLFILGIAAAPFVGVVRALLTGKTSYITHNIRAADKAAAAFLGFNGDKTISQECGDCPTCRYAKLLCPVLDKALQKDHCALSA
jgi:hypothetical protein